MPNTAIRSLELLITKECPAEVWILSGLNIIPRIITAIIGPIEHNAVRPNPSVSAPLSLLIAATPVPIAIMKGTLIGPVVTPPESNAKGMNADGTKYDSIKTVP